MCYSAGENLLCTPVPSMIGWSINPVDMEI
jgi:hypothetical protein